MDSRANIWEVSGNRGMWNTTSATLGIHEEQDAAAGHDFRIGLDRRQWNVLIREESKHGELQYYLPDEAYIENGMLRLRSRVRSYGSMKYTSGRISTDGKLIHTSNARVPHEPHYLIINTAVGGAWPGNPDSTTVFPQFHDVDYVRVYQRVKPYFE